MKEYSLPLVSDLEEKNQAMVHVERLATSFELEALEYGLVEAGISETDARAVRTEYEKSQTVRLREFQTLRAHTKTTSIIAALLCSSNPRGIYSLKYLIWPSAHL